MSLSTTDQSRAPAPNPSLLSELIAERTALEVALTFNRSERRQATRFFYMCAYEIEFIKADLKKRGYFGSTGITTRAAADKPVADLLQNIKGLRNLKHEIERRKNTAGRNVFELPREIFELGLKITYEQGLIEQAKEQKRQRGMEQEEIMEAYMAVMEDIRKHGASSV
ncbi:hypothetical protein P167DRAFT_537413 [Morchella conica CCBAS932]|uniref:Uncharacterized protein n=1 Tax=Morchella conica CCBAS932 TaxID=1392247 RepID=A0A3N4KN17_9PEZI|nr:hypothetical protein P167DRAFT_537413 [Morchella conica CCBAS932]